MAAHEDPDEWELVNDDGFVYKRKKRLLPVPHNDPTSSSSTPSAVDERKHHLQLKKRALLKLRDKYLKEIRHWELLSNILKELQTPHNSKPHHQTTSSAEPSSLPKDQSCSNPVRRRLVDDLLAQVEAQEAIIEDVTNLCDVAEALCNAQEERLKQQFTDLPVWEPSPDELMAALGKE